MGIQWDGTGINCYVMGQTNMFHGQSCKNTYSRPSKCCTTRFLQEATQHQNRWSPRSCKKLSPCQRWADGHVLRSGSSPSSAKSNHSPKLFFKCKVQVQKLRKMQPFYNKNAAFLLH